MVLVWFLCASGSSEHLQKRVLGQRSSSVHFGDFAPLQSFCALPRRRTVVDPWTTALSGFPAQARIPDTFSAPILVHPPIRASPRLLARPSVNPGARLRDSRIRILRT